MCNGICPLVNTVLPRNRNKHFKPILTSLVGLRVFFMHPPPKKMVSEALVRVFPLKSRPKEQLIVILMAVAPMNHALPCFTIVSPLEWPGGQ